MCRGTSGAASARTVPAGEQVVCDVAGVARITLLPWNGNDVVRTGFCSGFCIGVFVPNIPMTINGFAGDDVIQGGSSDDIIDAQGGSDFVTTFGGNDTINGDGSDADAGNDTIDAGAGNDVINGFAGNDTITGGTGDENVVDGGAGTDTFSYNDGRANGVTAVLNDGTTQNDGGTDDNANGTQREAL